MAAKSTSRSTGQVTLSWIRAQVSKKPKTKRQLRAAGFASNPQHLTAKEIVALKKTGKICPANKLGAYIAEGLDPRKNGGVELNFDEATKTYSL